MELDIEKAWTLTHRVNKHQWESANYMVLLQHSRTLQVFGCSSLHPSSNVDSHLSVDIFQPFGDCSFGLVHILLHQYWTNELIHCVSAVQQLQLLLMMAINTRHVQSTTVTAQMMNKLPL